MKKIMFLTVLLCLVVFALPAHADPQPKDVNVVNEPTVNVGSMPAVNFDGDVNVTNDSSNAVPVVDYTNRLFATAASNKSIGYEPLHVEFSSSIVGGTGPIAVNWDFGDGSPTSTVPNPTHNYGISGSFLVTLTAVDSLGLSAVSTLTIQVNVNRPPFARLVADRVVGVAPLKVKFDASDSFDPDGDPLNFDLNVDEPPWSTNRPFTTHVYNSPGTYAASVIVEDPNGMNDADFVEITVEGDTFPAVSASIPLDVFVGEAWDFTSSVTGGNQPLVYHWEFGDGSTSKMSNTSHTYVYPGTYRATLTVTDANGDFGSDSATVTVTVAP